MNTFIIIGNNENNNVFTFYIVLCSSSCRQTSGQATKEIRPQLIPGGLTSILVLLACENVLTDFLELPFKYGIP